MKPAVPATDAPSRESSRPDEASRAFVASLASAGREREEAERRLHELLVRASRFELSRRRASLAGLPAHELEEIVQEAAADALLAILARLSDFRGESRFTTWAYKFALYETAVKVRRRAWRGREISLEPESWAAIADRGAGPADRAARNEEIEALRAAVRDALTSHQRDVFVALALNEVPIDVLADRLGSTRGALYKTLHDARLKLRTHMAGLGFEIGRAGR